MLRRVPRLLVPLIALTALLASAGWLVTQERGNGWVTVGRGDRVVVSGRPGMAGSGFGWLRGDGRRVRDLPAARARAQTFATTLGPELAVGEVMRFSNHFYAELVAPDGSKVTEVLVDPRSGAVGLEPGPATMWNTRFGTMTAPRSGARLSVDQARAAAARWLQSRDGLAVGEPEAFPGYLTMHTLRGGRVEGMLSVHAVTGAVWYHGWHGSYQEMSEGQ